MAFSDIVRQLREPHVAHPSPCHYLGCEDASSSTIRISSEKLELPFCSNHGSYVDAAAPDSARQICIDKAAGDRVRVVVLRG